MDISENITKLKDTLGESHTNELSKQVTGFSIAAIDQLKQRLSQEVQKELGTFSSDFDSERTKTVKSSRGLLIYYTTAYDRRSIIVELQDATYASTVRYRCQDDVEYAFSLDTKQSPFFKNRFKPGQLDRSLKVPVGLGKRLAKEAGTLIFAILNNTC